MSLGRTKVRCVILSKKTDRIENFCPRRASKIWVFWDFLRVVSIDDKTLVIIDSLFTVSRFAQAEQRLPNLLKIRFGL
jgi:hypothetical protein